MSLRSVTCDWVYLRSDRRATTGAGGLSDELAHGVVEAHAENDDEEVDGISRAVFFGPPPVGVFDNDARELREVIVVGSAGDELESTFLKHWGERNEPGCADLLAGPAGLFVRAEGGHGLCASGVG